MGKLTGLEKHLVLAGLQLVREQMKESNKKIRSEGKIPLMTDGYVDMLVDSTSDKIPSLSLKDKK